MVNKKKRKEKARTTATTTTAASFLLLHFNINNESIKCNTYFHYFILLFSNNDNKKKRKPKSYYNNNNNNVFDCNESLLDWRWLFFWKRNFSFIVFQLKFYWNCEFTCKLTDFELNLLLFYLTGSKVDTLLLKMLFYFLGVVSISLKFLNCL